MKIIMISGKMGSGKTTLADSIQEALIGQGMRVLRTRFAKALYLMHDAVLEVARGYDIPVKEKEGDLLQLMGTEWARERFGADVWVNCLKAELASCDVVPPHYVIIDDCRFDSELDAFPEALTIRLECDEYIRKERCSMWRNRSDHPSETALDARLDAFSKVIYTDQLSAEETLGLALEAILQSEGDREK